MSDLEQVLVGSLLGDGALMMWPRSSNAHYEEIHSFKQRDYLLWKANMLREAFAIKVTESSYFDKRTDKTYYRVRLRTHVSPLLTELHGQFYINGKKTVISSVLIRLNVLGLCVWYLDDGGYCYLGRWAKLATCDFSLEENLLIQKQLKESFGLETTVYLQRSGYEIRFNVKNTKRLFSLIKTYVPKELEYKLGLDVKKEAKARSKAKLWEQQNKEKRRGQLKEWKITHRDRWLELKRQSSRRCNKKLKALKMSTTTVT